MIGWTAFGSRLAALALLLSACRPPGALLPEQDILRDVWVRGPASSDAVALTFDDGPNGRCTDAVLDALAETGAPGTFFVVGANVAPGRNDDVLARMVREGHTIGLHSHTHHVRPLFLRSLTSREIAQTTAAIEAALRRAGVETVPAMRFFRPPFGLVTAPTARAVADAGLTIVEWTVSVEDWRPGQDADAVTARILERVRPGDVILLHDGIRTHQRSLVRCTDRALVADVVRRLVPRLTTRGLDVVSLAALFGIDPGDSPPPGPPFR